MYIKSIVLIQRDNLFWLIKVHVFRFQISWKIKKNFYDYQIFVRELIIAINETLLVRQFAETFMVLNNGSNITCGYKCAVYISEFIRLPTGSVYSSVVNTHQKFSPS